jgi:hypothetical protein
LKGTATGDLPAELSTVCRLFVNLKTANQLGISADEVPNNPIRSRILLQSLRSATVKVSLTPA